MNSGTTFSYTPTTHNCLDIPKAGRNAWSIAQGQLETKALGLPFDKSPIASLKYIYATDGSIAAREVNGVKQAYQYDQIGQLTTVLDATGKAVEQYSYDPVGNILKKDINGEITTYSYDKSNQLLSSTTNGKTTKYEYDAAGRMVKEGDKSYAYNWLNKVMSISKNDKITNSYSYSVNGQIASATDQGKEENFIWDGLALIKRGSTDYVYEPAVTGGNPILANGKGLFNDMLGTTLGQYDGEKFTDNQRTSFGSGAKEGFFTGKPHVAGLGYAFLFRNYRSDLGKWQTSDPIGYPDGWNNLVYVNNMVTSCFDWQGTFTQVSDNIEYTSIGWRITGVIFIKDAANENDMGHRASITWKVTVNWKCLACNKTGSYTRTETKTVIPVDWMRHTTLQGALGFNSILNGIGSVLAAQIPALNYYVVLNLGVGHVINSRPAHIPYVKEHTTCE